MTLPVVYRPEVRDEVDEAYGWYEEQRRGLGDEFLDAVQVALNRIQENPYQNAVLYREVRAGLVRRFPYVVYYRAESERIVVIAIQHGRRHPGRWKRRA